MAVKIPRGESGGGEWKPLPDGDYDLRITKVETRQANNQNQDWQLMVQYETVGGLNPGKKLTDWMFLTKRAFWRIERLLDALMIEMRESGHTDSEGDPILEFEETELLQRVIFANVRIATYKTKDQDPAAPPQGRKNEIKSFEISMEDPHYAAVKAAKETQAAQEAAGTAQAAAPATAGQVQTAGPVTQAAAPAGPAAAGPVVPAGRRQRR